MKNTKQTTKELEFTIIVRIPAHDLGAMAGLEEAMDQIRGVGSCEVGDVRITEELKNESYHCR